MRKNNAVCGWEKDKREDTIFEFGLEGRTGVCRVGEGNRRYGWKLGMVCESRWYIWGMCYI